MATTVYRNIKVQNTLEDSKGDLKLSNSPELEFHNNMGSWTTDGSVVELIEVHCRGRSVVNLCAIEDKLRLREQL